MRSNPTALRSLRQAKGHTGPTLAKASGVSQQRISDLEAGPIPIRATTAKKLAEALDVPIAAITTIDAPEPMASR